MRRINRARDRTNIIRRSKRPLGHLFKATVQVPRGCMPENHPTIAQRGPDEIGVDLSAAHGEHASVHLNASEFLLEDPGNSKGRSLARRRPKAATQKTDDSIDLRGEPVIGHRCDATTNTKGLQLGQRLSTGSARACPRARASDRDTPSRAAMGFPRHAPGARNRER